MLKLFWNTDSPFCRIILWHIGASQLQDKITLEHLSWEEIRATAPGGQLGSNATVPCLELNNGARIADSLRILAHLLKDDFSSWILSQDGELYRHTEGQLSRVMYGLYDGPSPEALTKIKSRWSLALCSADSYFCSDEYKKRSASQLHALALPALHIFVQFCLNFQPEWRHSIPETLERTLLNLESRKEFEWFKRQLVSQAATVSVCHRQ